MVLGFCETSAIVFLPSAGEFEDAALKGLAMRDLVGRGVGVDIVAGAAGDHLPFFATASPPAGSVESAAVLV
jgi:hypothetical protein